MTTLDKGSAQDKLVFNLEVIGHKFYMSVQLKIRGRT